VERQDIICMERTNTRKQNNKKGKGLNYGTAKKEQGERIYIRSNNEM